MQEDRVNKLARQQRLAYYQQQAQVVYDAQQKGKGKTLAGEAWGPGFTVDDYAREMEIRYQQRVSDEIDHGVNYVEEPGAWFDLVDADAKGQEERRKLKLWTDQHHVGLPADYKR